MHNYLAAGLLIFQCTATFDVTSLVWSRSSVFSNRILDDDFMSFGRCNKAIRYFRYSMKCIFQCWVRQVFYPIFEKFKT